MAAPRKALSFDMADPASAMATKARTAGAGEPRKPIGSRVTVSVYRRAKARAAMNGEKLQDWVEGAILDKLAKEEGGGTEGRGA
jgi:hypothetical protein